METKIETGVVKENNELNGKALEQAYQTHIHKAHMFLALPLRLLILLAGTVLISALYKGMIASGIFKLITDTMQHRLVYCIFELLLLGGFWHGVFMFSKKCRHRSYSLGVYYLMACIIAAVYAGICCVLFHFLNREAYSWLLRITLNLCGLRFRTSFPDHLRPYLVAYLVITTLIMLLEPIIAKWQYRRFIRMQKKKPVSLKSRVQALRERNRKKRHLRHKRRWERAHERWKRKERKRTAREEKRKANWKKRMKKKKQSRTAHKNASPKNP